MQSITLEQLDSALDQFYALEGDDAIDQLVDEMAEAHPLVFAFLMTMGDQDFNEDERESLLFLGVGVWYIMRTVLGSEIPVVTEATLVAVRKANEPLFEATVDQENPSLEIHSQQWLAGYPQPEVLAYVVDEIQDQADEGDIRPANLVIMALFLKVVIDAYEVAVN